MSKNNIKKNKVSEYITINGRYRTKKPLFAKDVFTNVFDWGGASQRAWDKAWSSNNAAGSLGQLAGGLGTIISAGINNAQTTDTTGIESTIKDYRMAPIEMSSREGLLNQWTNNRGLNTNFQMTDFTPSDGQRISNTLSSTLSGAMTGAQIGGPWGALAGGVIGLGSGLAGIFVGNADARQKAETLNNQAVAANSQRNRNFVNAADFLDQQDFMLNMQNYAALGGPIVNIFAEGGSLSRTHGSDFTNGVTYINEGGTHEENPNEGVQIGVDKDGNPNLVEEGEVVFNDYVYSNRLYAKGGDLAKYNLPDKYDGYTFARIANELFKESEESPNDPISLETLKVTADRLRGLQEDVRAAVDKESTNKFKWGGGVDRTTARWTVNKQEVEKEARRRALKISQNEDSPAYKRVYSEIYNELNDEATATVSEQNKTYDERSAAQLDYDTVFGELKNLGYSDKYIYNNLVEQTTLGDPNPNRFKQEAYDLLDSYRAPSQSTNESSPSNKEPDVKTQNNVDSSNLGVDKLEQSPDFIGHPRPQNYKALEKEKPKGTGKGEKVFPDMDPIEDSIEASGIVADANPQDWRKGIPDIPTVFDNYQAPVEDWKYREPFDWNDFGNQALRYAPVIGNLIGLFGNKKDYTDVNTFGEDTRNPRSVRFTPIGGHYDTNYVSPYEMQNPIIQGAANTRRMLANSSLGNSVSMRNALMASDLQTQGLIGQALLQGKEYNNTQKQRAAEFRRNIDQYNSSGALQAQSANMGLNNYFYNRALNKYNMRNAIDMGYTQAQGANRTALYNNLGNIGKENVLWPMVMNTPGMPWGFTRGGNWYFNADKETV